MLTLRKTTLGDHNRGICGRSGSGQIRNNAYYTGATICWAIDHTGAEGENNLIAVSRKKDAVLIVSTINQNEPDWDGWNGHSPIDKAKELLRQRRSCWSDWGSKHIQLCEVKEV